MVPKSGAEHGARQSAKGLFAISPRLRSHNEEALETVAPCRVEANSPARPHSAVHIGAAVNRRRRHEQRHGRTGAHAQHHVAHRRHIRFRPRHGLAGFPIESLDVHLGLVRKERVEVEGHHLVGARQILRDSLIEVMRVEKPSAR